MNRTEGKKNNSRHTKPGLRGRLSEAADAPRVLYKRSL